MASEELPASMKAYILEEFGQPYQLRDVPLPKIEHPDDILIRVDAGSYCHTDAVMAAGTMHPPSLPHIGCHEYAGTIVALPQGKSSIHDLKIGDTVAVPGRGYHVCEKCRECQNPSGPVPDEPGFSVYCPWTHGGLGVHGPGGFREYAIVDSKQVSLIPDQMTAVEVAPLMCAGLTIYAALRKCNLQPGQRVGFIGCGGGLGHLGLQFATKMGLKVLGVDIAPAALQFSWELGTGADIVDALKTKAEDVRQQLGQMDGAAHISEMGLDAVLILTDSQQSFNYGVDLVRNGGLVVVVSFPPQGFQVSAADLVFRRIRLEGTLIGSNKAMKEMLDFCVKHDVKARVKTYPFLRLNDLVEAYHSGTPGKLVVDFSMRD